MTDIDRHIKRAENERKDAIENGDRKGRWYAEGKIDAFKTIRIEQSSNPPLRVCQTCYRPVPYDLACPSCAGD